MNMLMFWISKLEQFLRCVYFCECAHLCVCVCVCVCGYVKTKGCRHLCIVDKKERETETEQQRCSIHRPALPPAKTLRRRKHRRDDGILLTVVCNQAGCKSHTPWPPPKMYLFQSCHACRALLNFQRWLWVRNWPILSFIPSYLLQFERYRNEHLGIHQVLTLE